MPSGDGDLALPLAVASGDLVLHDYPAAQKF
jgi:hypothetical protein